MKYCSECRGEVGTAPDTENGELLQYILDHKATYSVASGGYARKTQMASAFTKARLSLTITDPRRSQGTRTPPCQRSHTPDSAETRRKIGLGLGNGVRKDS